MMRDEPNGRVPSFGWTNLAKALLVASREFPAVAKRRVARIELRGRPGYEYRYADLSDVLDAVRPVLAKHGILLFFRSRAADSGVAALQCVLAHAETGEMLHSELPLTVDEDPKAFGARLTYLRRYLLALLTAIAPEAEAAAAAEARRDALGPPGAAPERPELRWVFRKLDEAFGAGPVECDPRKREVLRRAVGSDDVGKIRGLPPEELRKRLRERFRLVLQEVLAESKPAASPAPAEGAG